MESIFTLLQDSLNVQTIIALIALTTAILQGVASRSHNKLSVQPYLCDHLDQNSQDKSIHFKIINKGLGTAKIASFTYLWDKQKISSTSLEQKIIGLAGENINFTIHSMGKGHALAKDEAVTTVYIQISSQNHDLCDSEERYETIKSQLLGSLRLTINYESIYKQKFQYKTNPTSFSPVELAITNE